MLIAGRRDYRLKYNAYSRAGGRRHVIIIQKTQIIMIIIHIYISLPYIGKSAVKTECCQNLWFCRSLWKVNDLGPISPVLMFVLLTTVRRCYDVIVTTLINLKTLGSEES